MKIDLHIHTIQTKKGDGTSRNVTPDVFNQSLKDAGVGLGAITNHNMFDEDQFMSLIDKKSYKLLPGIEVDFIINSVRSQMNIIFSDENIKEAVKISDFLKINSVSSVAPIDLNLLIKELSAMDIILFVDRKGKNTEVDYETIEYIRKKLDQAAIICDANNMRTLRILAAKNMSALIGSDIQSWKDNKYVDESFDLVDSQ